MFCCSAQPLTAVALHAELPKLWPSSVAWKLLDVPRTSRMNVPELPECVELAVYVPVIVCEPPTVAL
jgi:hypothetical protein